MIGQGRTANLRLGDAGVAPEHARVRPEAGAYWVEALATGAPTLLGGYPVPLGQAFPLTEGSVLGLGSVELVYSEAESEEAARALAPVLRLSVDAGPNAGYVTPIRGRVLVGSGPDVNVCIGGLDPVHLEIAEHGPAFWVRDLTSGKTFRAGRPLGAEFVVLEHGDLLLAGTGVLLRFEET